MPNPSDEYNHIESIGFEVQQGMGIVSIGTASSVQYERLADEDRKVTLKIMDVILADKFQVSRDVSDFDSPINFISSFRDPICRTTIMVIELKEDDARGNRTERQRRYAQFRGDAGTAESASGKGEVEVEVKPEDLYAFDFRLTSIPGAT
jgi:hypothetical protein